MPPPLPELASIALLDDSDRADRGLRRDALYALLRREQSIAADRSSARPEVSRILDFAQAAYGDLVGVLVGRDDKLLDSARDGDWTLRDVLRHAIAVELRYAAQVDYSATRADSDPVEIPPELLPCDRLSPPEAEFGGSRRGGVHEILELLAKARAMSDSRLASVPDSALGRPSQWGKKLIDVRTRLHQIAVHLTETAIQVEKIVERGGEFRAIMRRCCMTRGMHERWSGAKERENLDESYRAATP